jgi:hypothetical protein
MLSQSQSELKKFEKDFLNPKELPREIAIAPRKFEAMANVESMMWLQLGVELGIFNGESAKGLFEKYSGKLLSSLKYVERTKNYAKPFRGEVEIFANQIKEVGIPFVQHPNRLSDSLFAEGCTEMLFHEVGYGFRDGILTMCLDFASPRQFRRQAKGKPNPVALIRNRNLRGTNLVMSKYLAFLGHAGELQQLWEYLDSVSESSYAISTLRQRVSSMHNWRVDLHTEHVRDRFNEITRMLIDGVEADEQLQNLGFNPTELLSQIKEICSSWEGDDTMAFDDTVAGGGNKQASAKGQRQARLRERKKPPLAA